MPPWVGLSFSTSAFFGLHGELQVFVQSQRFDSGIDGGCGNDGVCKSCRASLAGTDDEIFYRAGHAEHRQVGLQETGDELVSRRNLVPLITHSCLAGSVGRR